MDKNINFVFNFEAIRDFAGTAYGMLVEKIKAGEEVSTDDIYSVLAVTYIPDAITAFCKSKDCFYSQAFDGIGLYDLEHSTADARKSVMQKYIVDSLDDEISSGIMSIMKNTDCSFDDVIKLINLLYDDVVVVYPWMNRIVKKMMKCDKFKAFFEFANRQNTHVARQLLYNYYLETTVTVAYMVGNPCVIVNGKEL
jgi:23S rRNA A2030 N6-methylase RlmJ